MGAVGQNYLELLTLLSVWVYRKRKKKSLHNELFPFNKDRLFWRDFKNKYMSVYRDKILTLSSIIRVRKVNCCIVLSFSEALTTIAIKRSAIGKYAFLLQ